MEPSNIFLDSSLRLALEGANNSFDTSLALLGSSSDPFRSHSLLAGEQGGVQKEPTTPQQGEEVPPAKAPELFSPHVKTESVSLDFMGIPPSGGPRNYVDVTPYLNLSQVSIIVKHVLTPRRMKRRVN